MKIRPLFQMSEFNREPSDEEMLRFLDEPETSEDRRAFLNQCVLLEGGLERWNELQQVVRAGKDLTRFEPSPEIRVRVMEAAFAFTRKHHTRRAEPVRRTSFRQLPGWRLAWAALFLALSWSGYLHFQPQQSSLIYSEEFNYELLTLQEDLDALQAVIALDNDYYSG